MSHQERLTRQPTLEYVLHRLQHHPVTIGAMISLGAGRGDDTPLFLKRWPQAHALLIDMDPQFAENYRRLSTQHPAIAHAICAVAAQDGAGHFRKNDRFGGAIVSTPTHTDPSATPVTFRSLDSLVAEYRLPPPYFLKFDTHGAELEILAGAPTTLQRTELILMEVYNFKLKFMQEKNLTFDEMSLHMKQLGFRCIDLCDPLYRPGDFALWQFHMLFLRADHPTFSRASYNIPPTDRSNSTR